MALALGAEKEPAAASRSDFANPPVAEQAPPSRDQKPLNSGEIQRNQKPLPNLPTCPGSHREKLNLARKRRRTLPCAMDSYKELPLNAETITTRRANIRRDAGPVLPVDVKKQLRAVVRALARSAAIAEHTAANVSSSMIRSSGRLDSVHSAGGLGRLTRRPVSGSFMKLCLFQTIRPTYSGFCRMPFFRFRLPPIVEAFQ